MSSLRVLATTAFAAALAPAVSAQFNNPWVAFEEDPSLLSVSGPLADLQNEVDVDWGDLDGDGWTDLVVVRKEPILAAGPRTNVLLMNVSGVLTDLTASLAVDSDVPGGQGFLDATPDRDVVLADINNDGLLDCITAPDQTDGLPKNLSHPRVYVNLGSGGGSWGGLRHEDARFPELLHNVSGLPKAPRFTAVDAGDVDLDGWVDLYFGDQDENPGFTFQGDADDLDDRLMINLQNGFFIDQSTTAMTDAMLNSRFCNSVELVDVNLDGTLEMIKQTSHESPVQVKVAYNNPVNPGTFAALAPAYQGSPYFVQTGDLNNDGRMDLVVSDNGPDRYILNEATLPSGAVQWSAPNTYEFLAGGDDSFASNSLVADVDGDGWNDVLITDVDPEFPGYNRRMHLYHNLGGTVGGDVTLREERASTSNDHWVGAPGMLADDLRGSHDVAVFDVNLDGYQDVLVFRRDKNQIYRGVEPETCQVDLGFGSGEPVLQVCGGDLSLGSDATLRIFNGQPGSPGGLLVSLTAFPTYSPLLDETLVALPPIVTVPIATDGNGDFELPIAGGTGPATFVIQALIANGGPTLADATNAVQVTVLP